MKINTFHEKTKQQNVKLRHTCLLLGDSLRAK